MIQKIIYIVGPTASGKTNISNSLSTYFNIPILSMDSMQIYKELNIGTSKPSKEELKKINYFGINVVDPDVHYSTADYIKYAHNTISTLNDIAIIITGGTGLYYDGLTIGFSKIPSKDETIRKKLYDSYYQNGIEQLFEKLKNLDYEYSQKISKNDVKRIIRALEVCEITGKPFSSFHNEKDIGPLRQSCLKFGLILPRKKLYKRIDERVDLMFENGFLEEARKIYDKYSQYDLPSLKAMGYSDLFEYFEGKADLNEVIDRIKRKTRNYAKRQLTWFKKDKEITWLYLLDEVELEVAKNIRLDNFESKRSSRKKNRHFYNELDTEILEFISSVKKYDFIDKNKVVEYLKYKLQEFIEEKRVE